VSDPYQQSSALQLISPDDGCVIDGYWHFSSRTARPHQTIFLRYEFAWNEFVNTLQIVTLETQSTESGEKDFIACGTSVFRGEDLAVRGAVSLQTCAIMTH
jgi:cleavage and polyadenylation specificity factor subunit 1